MKMVSGRRNQQTYEISHLALWGPGHPWPTPQGNLWREIGLDLATMPPKIQACSPTVESRYDIMQIGCLDGLKVGRDMRCLESMKRNHEPSVRPSPS